MASQSPLSKAARNQSKTGCAVAFFLLFAVVGTVFLVPFFILPVWQIWQARSWEAVACTILESHVETHEGEDGDTYSVEVRYRYEVGGEAFEGSRYQFMGGSSSGYSGKAEVVEGLPPGAVATCYVNPHDPTDSVLHRGFTPALLFGLIPLVFVAVGVGGAWALWRGRRRERPGAAGWHRSPGTGRPEAESLGEGFAFVAGSNASFEGPLVLEPKLGPLGKFIGIVFVAAFWNGIVGIFVWQWYEGFRAGSTDGCLTVFLIPFVLIGLLLLLGVPYQFLALFNPRPRLTLGRGALAVGESTELSWRFSGAPGRIRHLAITLEGREEATYRQGTSTSTAKNTFASYTLLATSLAPEIPAGSTTISIPADTMHTFEAPHNKILWTLKVAGEIRFWPDVEQEFPFTVLPPHKGER